MGSIFLVFGLIGFLDLFFDIQVMETPSPEPGTLAELYFNALTQSYLMKTVKIVEILGGFMLISGFWLPLGVAMLSPIVINILLMHLTMDPSTIAMAVILVLCKIGIVTAYWGNFRTLFQNKKY